MVAFIFLYILLLCLRCCKYKRFCFGVCFFVILFLNKENLCYFYKVLCVRVCVCKEIIVTINN